MTLRRWRTPAEEMAFADCFTLMSVIGVGAAEAIRGENVRIADLSTAVEELGLAWRAPERTSEPVFAVDSLWR